MDTLPFTTQRQEMMVISCFCILYHFFLRCKTCLWSLLSVGRSGRSKFQGGKLHSHDPTGILLCMLTDFLVRHVGPERCWILFCHCVLLTSSIRTIFWLTEPFSNLKRMFCQFYKTMNNVPKLLPYHLFNLSRLCKRNLGQLQMLSESKTKRFCFFFVLFPHFFRS